eukprot:TRINITY_DN7113_c0_g1_i1.p1 TRINITY_DN7113_c0_g1~~TRINITY_DN7113_c0_g1_i1.p1  ORF type:complete len:215 (-),score=12.19 TRINITY_DN7113_c0_g1_i1:63-707(-)
MEFDDENNSRKEYTTMNRMKFKDECYKRGKTMRNENRCKVTEKKLVCFWGICMTDYLFKITDNLLCRCGSTCNIIMMDILSPCIGIIFTFMFFIGLIYDLLKIIFVLASCFCCCMSSKIQCNSKVRDISEVDSLDCCEGMVACVTCECSKMCLGPKICQCCCDNSAMYGQDTPTRSEKCAKCFNSTFCYCYVGFLVEFFFILITKFFKRIVLKR